MTNVFMNLLMKWPELKTMQLIHHVWCVQMKTNEAVGLAFRCHKNNRAYVLLRIVIFLLAYKSINIRWNKTTKLKSTLVIAGEVVKNKIMENAVEMVLCSLFRKLRAKAYDAVSLAKFLKGTSGGDFREHWKLALRECLKIVNMLLLYVDEFRINSQFRIVFEYCL